MIALRLHGPMEKISRNQRPIPGDNRKIGIQTKQNRGTKRGENHHRQPPLRRGVKQKCPAKIGQRKNAGQSDIAASANGIANQARNSPAARFPLPSQISRNAQQHEEDQLRINDIRLPPISNRDRQAQSRKIQPPTPLAQIPRLRRRSKTNTITTRIPA